MIGSFPRSDNAWVLEESDYLGWRNNGVWVGSPLKQSSTFVSFLRLKMLVEAQGQRKVFHNRATNLIDLGRGCWIELNLKWRYSMISCPVIRIHVLNWLYYNCPLFDGTKRNKAKLYIPVMFIYVWWIKICSKIKQLTFNSYNQRSLYTGISIKFATYQSLLHFKNIKKSRVSVNPVLTFVCRKVQSRCSITVNVQDLTILNTFLCHGKTSKFILIVRLYSNRKLRLQS